MTPRQRVSYAVKFIVAHVLYYTGLLRLWQRIVMRDKAVVLMYHRVLTREERHQSASHPALVVDRNTFAAQMAAVRRWFTVLSIEEFADALERGVPLPSASCVITFDDGWRDSFTNALPILAQHALPALVFLPVNYIGGKRLFWQEALTHLLVRAVAEVRRDPHRRMAIRRVLGAYGLSDVADLDGEDVPSAIRAAVASQKALTRSATESLVDALARELGVRIEALATIDGFIDWREVQVMSEQRIAFGGHGAEHLLLTQVSQEEAEREIHTSKHVIASRVAGKVLTFSYPNGYYTPEIVDRVKACGYRLAFSTKRGFVSCGDDPMTVRRLNVHEAVTATTPMFLARVMGVL